MVDKTCTLCKKILPLEAFGWKVKATGRVNARCKKCMYAITKAWAKDNPEGQKVAARKTRYKKIEYLRQLKSNPCVDCGNSFHFSAMDFDHRPGTEKLFGPNRGRDRGWQQLLDEIAKCDLVCANCHRVRTFKRSGGYEDVDVDDV